MIDRLSTLQILGTAQLQKLTLEKFNKLIDYQKPILLTGKITVNWNIKKGYNSKLILNSNKILVLEQLTPGDYGTIELVQDATGSRTLTLPSNSIVIGTQGTATLTLTTTANAIDIATFYYNGTTIYWNISLW